ncbi:MAG: sigma-54-dependent Fis family transcriptional regulator [Candidatus Eisenbacteria sp.]|nr:sigma-54-dependent Fis family transcriptional regulator [Candidatus Eisenbacteria bacterium]
MKRLLIVDDDVAVTNYLMVFLMQTGVYEPTVMNDSREVPDLLGREVFDAILLDMDMPNVSGIDILKLINENRIETPVVVLTGVNDADLAVKSLKLGALDYLIKPVDDELLLDVLDKAIRQRALRSTISRIPTQPKREDLANTEVFDRLPTQDPVMIRLFHQVEKMAAGDLSILIMGERGTGKRHLARAIHALSPRRDEPFVAVDVGAHDSEHFAAAFFGRARDWKGEREEQAGFLEEASGGTLFISDIEKLTVPVQIRLIRVMRAREFYRESSPRIREIDVRIIAASSRDLTLEEYKDALSQDLLRHLIVHSVRLPSLRERVDDIPLLAKHFLAQEARKAGKSISELDEKFIEILRKYEFRGNLQELGDIIAMCAGNAEGEIAGMDCLSPYMRDIVLSGGREPEEFRLCTLEEAAREHVKNTLNILGNDREKSALALGISVEEIDSIMGTSV